MLTAIALLLCAGVEPAHGRGPAFTPVPIQEVTIDDPFWSPKRDVWRRVTIADCFDKFEKDGALANFDKVRDGTGRGTHGGPQWYDGLLYETITGAADFLVERPDPQLRRRISGYVARIAAAAARDPDGYVNTWTQLKEPGHRWGADGGNDREQHDLYNAGCLVEAGVHFYRATGDVELMRVAARLANHMCDIMGPPPRRNLVPGHAVGEAALVELYTLFREQPDLKKRLPFPVDEKRYLALAQFWIDNRGHHDGRRSFGAYGQDDKPVLQQEAIEGHAVRATLLATGLTALASAADRDDYRQAAKRLWASMADRRTYVTGGVGAIAGDEKFGADYDLPNGGYLETCAAVGAAFFHHRMNVDAGRARYADELERVLYNGALCGVSLSGDRYFYENPLEAGKGRLRWAWHACPCCPPMFLKLVGAMPGYVYATSPDGLYVNLYAGSTVRAKVGGRAVSLRQQTRYPWTGDVRLTVEDGGIAAGGEAAAFDLNLRVPAWCQGPADPDALYTYAGRPAEGAFAVTVNGTPIMPTTVDGYARLHRNWQAGDVVEVRMAMPPRRVTAHPKVAAAAGRVALTRGPIVYCLESADNDGRVRNLSLPDDAELRVEERHDLLGGVTVLRAKTAASFAGEATPRAAELTAIPYYANANRGPASMAVWVPRSTADAVAANPAEAATPSASHTNPSDTLAALSDGRLPKSSDDESLPRFTWWDHRGTKEWAQYKFGKPTKLTAASVYWWDERRVNRHCRVPAAWRLVYMTADGAWAPVAHPSGYGVAMDAFNRVTFDPVETTALRIEADLQPAWSAGILEWQVELGSTATGVAPAAAAATTAVPAANPATAPTTIRVDARGPGRPVSRYLAGACIEDVNHEIYGGIYSQMIFGESFQEPAGGSPVKGFNAFGGDWKPANGELAAAGSDGPKLVSGTVAPFADGEVGVDVLLPAANGQGGGTRNAGLIVRVANPGDGADRFDGYEVALDAGRKVVGVGRHRQDYRLLKDAPCEVSTDRWVSLSVKLAGRTIEVSVDGKSVATVEDPRPLAAGTVGLRQWQRSAKYRNFWAKPAGGQRVDLPFDPTNGEPVSVSGMWGPVTTGDAVLAAGIERDRPFVGTQSQRLTHSRGTGEAGVENRGLNRQGMAFVAGKPYEGYVWLRSAKPVEVFASAESGDGAKTYARAKLSVAGGDEWRRYDFSLTPDAADPSARFSLRLAAPGSVVVGHAFLQPGEWGRFKGLPVRRDVAEGLIDQGVTVLRYGGSMVNTEGYQWKKMVGPRDRRPPYRGHWYAYSTNGWGIVDFLNLCEAAGFLAIPDFNLDESPQDMADFVEYVNGPADSEWGRRRAADGHPAPYKLRYLELGNEEKVDDVYLQKFERLVAAIWAKDPSVVPVVGDFQYERPITDPTMVEGAASHVTSLAAHKKILELAKKADKEVWFDVHVWTDGPNPTSSYRALPTYVDALGKLADGAKHSVVVFEFNANNHAQRRALANADGIGLLTRDGRVPVVLSANSLQVDGQNDNGWDQGLLFLNPSKVWLQPPGYVTRMVARHYQPRVIDAAVEGAGATGTGPAGTDDRLTVTATRSEDGKQVVLQVVNTSAEPRVASVRIDGFAPAKPVARTEALADPLDAKNTAAEPTRITPRQSEWRHEMKDGRAAYTFPPHSFTVIRME